MRIPVRFPSASAPSSTRQHLGAGRIARGHVLAARHRQAHGPAQDHRRARDERVDDHDLAAERAAEGLAADADALDRQPEQLGQRVARGERRLRGAGDDELAVGIDPRGRGLGLDVALIHPRRAQVSLDHHVAAGQRGVDVAVLEACRVEHVVGQLLLVADAAGGDRRVGVAEV